MYDVTVIANTFSLSLEGFVLRCALIFTERQTASSHTEGSLGSGC